MKEAFIENIINCMCRLYGYGVIEVKCSDGLMSPWAMTAAMNENVKKVVVFTSSSFNSDFQLINSLREDLNCDNIQFVKVILTDNDEYYSEELQAIAINYMSKRIVFYSDDSQNTAYELANCIAYTEQKTRDRSNKFSSSLVTYLIIAVNIAMYALTAVLSRNFIDSDINVLISLGAKQNQLIASGEYYRLIACMFLHGGLLHLAFNMYALYSIGPLVESIYGKIKYILIYFISGIISSLFSFIFSDSVSIGASGAIFGLLGTTLVYAVRMRRNIGKDFLRNIASVIIINLFIGFTLSNIDNYGHLGGLLGGVVAAIIINKKTMEA